MPRRTSTVQPSKRQNGKEGNVKQEDSASEDGSEHEDMNMQEVVSMIKEIEKRKNTKASSRSVTFDNKKSALFDQARKDADAILCDGITHM
ncbi:hypothetical protein NLI96_g2436 [Meripilus lineatus]|uniref:Uncharacterized protein n=1 Tax=Meripilus lineatus TaxID=2056292 RepID=A0AAD5YGJ8_9APHY|nr:hypothetical protein NLI96_g2436 [Physisporinus lineatus]